MNIACLDCGKEISYYTEDCLCPKCKAEKEHDFDAEPHAVFDYLGRRIKPVIRVTIEGDSYVSPSALEGFTRDLLYEMSDESLFELEVNNFEWDGHSGGDDAYFGLKNHIVKVDVNV